MLEVQDLGAAYGAVTALRGVTLRVGKGEVVSLIGANGAGKSTLLRVLSGILPPSNGRVILGGRDITRWPAGERVKAGLVLVPEGRRLFGAMTVEDNLHMGAHVHGVPKPGDSTLGWCYELFPKLKERRGQLAGTLSGGEQQMVAIARGLMSRPSILMLDEPSLGLAPLIVQQIFGILGEVHARGVTLLVIEQNAAQALKFSHRGYVLETGTLALEGASKDLLGNDAVRRAYLGG
ncbi:MAG: ABC transporter ATP-binding protein [Planctomycetota bacterium]